MSRFQHIFAISCLAPYLILADFSNDVAYIAGECLSCAHLDARHGSLHVFAKDKRLTDDEMAERLLFIANPANGFTNCYGAPLTRAALGGIIEFPNAVNALPALEDYISIPDTRMEALCAFGRITKHNDHFFTVTQNAVENNSLDKVFYLCYIQSVVNSEQLGLATLDDLTRCRMECILIRGTNLSFEGTIGFDDFLSKLLSGYTNSIEHIRAQQRINEFLIQRKNHILEYSIYRFVGDNKQLSDEEWYRRATNSCQTEIARVMALPENERLNMTAILDAKIAAIEAAEARAARRAVWKRRFRLGAFFLPIPVVALVIFVVLKKTNDKSGWCRTTESFVAVIVMVAVLGVLSFVEHRHQAQKTTTATTETPPPVATMTESEALQWLEACRDKLRQEKERTDDAVIKYRATNQLDFLKSQYESLKLAHDLLLLDLAKAESRESNEVATADLVSLREKETENARVRAELQDRISKVEGKLSQLESARLLADDNLRYILRRIELVRFSMKKEPPMWE